MRYHSGSELGKSDLQNSSTVVQTAEPASAAQSLLVPRQTPLDSSVLHPSAVRDHTPTSIESSLSLLALYPNILHFHIQNSARLLLALS